MPLSAQERHEINDLAQQFEAATGAQVVAAIVGKADDYPDVPWKAEIPTPSGRLTQRRRSPLRKKCLCCVQQAQRGS